MDRTRCYNMNCMEGMRKFPDKWFDLAIVDPPYGMNLVKTGYKETSYDYDGIKKANENPPKQDYFHELFRVSKNQIIWGANYLLDFLNKTNGFIIWDKQRCSENFADGEVAWSSIGTTKIYQHRWDGYMKASEHGKKRIHPTQKPVALYKWLLKNYAKEGDKILDTHLGSQSSRIAAFDMGFEYIGYEIDKDYFEAGNKRFNQHKQQLKLFEV